MTTARRFRVMFICIGNACRSPMAEAIARRDADKIMESCSAGLYPLGDLCDLTRETLIANGCTTDGLCSKPVTLKALVEADVIVNLSGLQLDRIFNRPFAFHRRPACEIRANIEEWDVRDPYGGDAKIYQQTFRTIERRVRQLAERLRATGPAAHA
jgi:protein-tyrosine-phosphatase